MAKTAPQKNAWLSVLALGFSAGFLLQSGSSFADDDPGPAIYAAEAPAVIRIRAVGVKSDGTMDGEDGTGFVISSNGYLLTASHVVPQDEAYTRLIIGGNLGPETAGGKSYALRLVKRDERSDTALLKFEAPPADLTVLPMRKTTPKAGESVFVLGYPLALPSTHLLDGRIEAAEKDVLTTNALVDNRADNVSASRLSISHSHITKTSQPSARTISIRSRSRATLRSIFASQ